MNVLHPTSFYTLPLVCLIRVSQGHSAIYHPPFAEWICVSRSLRRHQILGLFHKDHEDALDLPCAAGAAATRPSAAAAAVQWGQRGRRDELECDDDLSAVRWGCWWGCWGWWYHGRGCGGRGELLSGWGLSLEKEKEVKYGFLMKWWALWSAMVYQNTSTSGYP